MTHKQQLSHLTFPQRSVIFSRILLLGVAAAATSVVTMVAPRSAVAQNSPVSVTVVNPTTPGTPGGIGGTSLSETTTTETTETTTTTGETTTTTTTTVTETTTSTTTTETEVGLEATTTVVDDTATTAVPPEPVQPEVVQEAAPQPTGEVMMTTTAEPPTPTPISAPVQETPAPPPPAAAPQQQAAVTTTVVEQFIFGTTIETVYVRGLAGRLGTSETILLQTRVFQVVTGLSGNQTALLQAFQAALERAGIFNLAAYNNAGFADLIANSGNAELAMQIFSRLATNRLLLVYRLGSLSSLSVRQGLVGVQFARFTFTQYVVYQGLGVRFTGFPRERRK
ncbi:hypothetical protein [[Phormidium] sp. ETS-05]|uniref:hypothetical protein n=1 Tax=[Phormidium] sp. ETS-05 TaxID=222819 RepID=UPI0018EF13F3|nr:hypothetical protein [[Phormidium] sp. ETS-05]